MCSKDCALSQGSAPVLVAVMTDGDDDGGGSGDGGYMRKVRNRGVRPIVQAVRLQLHAVRQQGQCTDAASSTSISPILHAQAHA